MPVRFEPLNDAERAGQARYRAELARLDNACQGGARAHGDDARCHLPARALAIDNLNRVHGRRLSLSREIRACGREAARASRRMAAATAAYDTVGRGAAFHAWQRQRQNLAPLIGPWVETRARERALAARVGRMTREAHVAGLAEAQAAGLAGTAEAA